MSTVTRGRPKSETWKRAPVIAAAYQAGASSVEIASWFGCSPELVQGILRSRGVTLRRGRPRNP